LLRDYARVWEDFDPAQRMDAEEQIRRVRSRLASWHATERTQHGGSDRCSGCVP
jgi:hypothetical protein